MTTDTLDRPSASVLTAVNLVYGLHALSLVTGIVGTATVIGSFLGGIPSLVAVVLNYATRSGARGTWVESHYRWQIRTFWYAVLWFVIGSLSVIVLVGIPILIALTLWLLYRVVKGWIRLRNRRPMYT